MNKVAEETFNHYQKAEFFLPTLLQSCICNKATLPETLERPLFQQEIHSHNLTKTVWCGSFMQRCGNDWGARKSYAIATLLQRKTGTMPSSRGIMTHVVDRLPQRCSMCPQHDCNEQSVFLITDVSTASFVSKRIVQKQSRAKILDEQARL